MVTQIKYDTFFSSKHKRFSLFSFNKKKSNNEFHGFFTQKKIIYEKQIYTYFIKKIRDTEDHKKKSY